MRFYSSIADHYSEIFPFNSAQLAFVQQAFPNLQQQNLLDIGCANGVLASKLAPLCKAITGIDLNRKMLKKAHKEIGFKHPNLELMELDMMHVSAHFGVYAFSGILCFGNTLVHLTSVGQIRNFLSNCKAVLKKDGKLLLQILNYDRILDEKIDQLPLIENEALRFHRTYQQQANDKLIQFKTTLQLKGEALSMENEIPLYPLRQKELEALLLEVGFTSLRFYSDFKQHAFSSGSYALVVEAV